MFAFCLVWSKAIYGVALRVSMEISKNNIGFFIYIREPYNEFKFEA